jgi:hypothetical protein
MMNIHAGLSGRIAWEVRTRSGLRLEVGGCSNLITDSGLDQFGTLGAAFQQNFLPHSGMRLECILGDGTAAPQFTNVELAGALVASSGSPGGFANEITSNIVADESNDQIRGEFTTVHLFTFATAVNIREFGYRLNAGTNLAIRELIRNASGVPITLSINGSPSEPLELKIKHTLTVNLNFESFVSGSFPVAGSASGSVDYRQCFWSSGNPSQAYFVFDPVNGPLCSLMTNADDAIADRLTKPGAGVFVDSQPDPYMTGSHQRIKTAVFPSSFNVPEFFGVAWFPRVIENGLSGTHGHRFVGGGFKTAFSSPSSLEKPLGTKYTQKFVSSWGRL